MVVPAKSGNPINPVFTTYERSFITGVDDAINRGYDSHERFLQPDPAGMEAVRLTEPQSLNPYAYVGNDPVNRSDPAGLNDTSDVISAVTGLGSSVLGFIPGFALSGGALGTFSAGVTLGAMSGPFTFYIAPPVTIQTLRMQERLILVSRLRMSRTPASPAPVLQLSTADPELYPQVP